MSTTRENPDPVSPNDEPIEEDIVSPCADMTREQLVQDSPMKIDPTRISPKWWGVKVTATSKELHLNTYMVEQIKDLCILGLYDAELLYVFQKQFEGWTEQMFKRVHHTYLRAMKKGNELGGYRPSDRSGVNATLPKNLLHRAKICVMDTFEHLFSPSFELLLEHVKQFGVTRCRDL
ncbi:uncharacterized protein N7515_006912 [Penicillium bovifimosum]|uniref:Uncharacterized protein n=1 Tax=Penicillium bovifimosum TaxID=126998 RepID=A0A9W9GVU2_9EURO|nr:uncharacterized protein N7515_006912 [Penicillium bovifimosum]KAJ5130873.1 hypothetical protein N7515_006912 [Penicillium bovifimosum]